MLSLGSSNAALTYSCLSIKQNSFQSANVGFTFIFLLPARSGDVLKVSPANAGSDKSFSTSLQKNRVGMSYHTVPEKDPGSDNFS